MISRLVILLRAAAFGLFALMFMLLFSACREDYLYSGQAATEPWAGYWWPMLESSGQHLYDSGGAMEKYDAFMVAGGDPSQNAKALEYALLPNGHRVTDRSMTWFGHCNGWSAASILEDEPTNPISAGGRQFSTSDLKGLLTELHYTDAIDMWFGERYDGNPGQDINDPYPNEFHKAVLNVIGEMHLALVMDLKPGIEVWNYPVYGYTMTYSSDLTIPQRKHVTCTLSYETDGVSPDYVGHRSTTKVLTYYLDGSDLSSPTAGAWEGNSVNDHPDFMWHPRKSRSELDRTHANMFVDYHYVKQIYPALK